MNQDLGELKRLMGRVSKETLLFFYRHYYCRTFVVSLTFTFDNSIQQNVAVILFFEDCFYIEKKLSNANSFQFCFAQYIFYSHKKIFLLRHCQLLIQQQ